MTDRPLLHRIRRRLQLVLSKPFDRHVRLLLRYLQNAGRDYQPIFVVGATGSGTGLLAVSLGQRFDGAGVIYESNLQISKTSFLFVPPVEAFDSVMDYRLRLNPAES